MTGLTPRLGRPRKAGAKNAMMVDHASENLDSGEQRHDGPGPSAASELMPAIYEELRRLAHLHMRREPSGGAGHTLQTTAIVHEAYIRMARQNEAVFNDRTHFYAIASQMIRRVLVDHARTKQSLKRGGSTAGNIRDRLHIEDVTVATLDPHDSAHGLDVLALDEALNELGALDERQCRVVELRYFGGLSIEETAAALNVSIGTVKGDWRVARAWLKQRLVSEMEQ